MCIPIEKKTTTNWITDDFILSDEVSRGAR